RESRISNACSRWQRSFSISRIMPPAGRSLSAIAYISRVSLERAGNRAIHSRLVGLQNLSRAGLYLSSLAQCHHIIRVRTPLDNLEDMRAPSVQGGALFNSEIMSLVDANNAGAAS